MSEALSSSMPEGRSRRSIKNMLVRPREQLRYAFVFFGGGLAIMALYMILFLYYMNSTIMTMANAYSIAPDVASTLSTALLTASIATVIFAATLTMIMFAAGLALSHRIFGPVTPIKRQIDDLRAGKYESRVQLRKRDEFHELADALNDLAATLETAKKT